MRVDRVSARPKKVLIVVANPATSTTLGWPAGFWGAELTHPYYELTQRGVAVTIASPDGGKVQMDSLSDPRDDSKWSADDLITMGFAAFTSPRSQPASTATAPRRSLTSSCLTVPT